MSVLGALLLTGEDAIRINTWCSVAGVTLALEGRLLDEHGCVLPFAIAHAPNSDRSLAQTIASLGVGRLTNLSARVASGTVKRGQCWVELEIVRGLGSSAQPLGVLARAYAAAGNRLAWPGGPIGSSVDGPGVMRLIVGTDPAAGVEIVETVPVGARWRLLAFSYGLLASAAAANRFSVLSIDDGANLVYQTSANTALTASLLGVYRGAAGVPVTTVGTQHFDVPLPDGLVLGAGTRILTSTTALQAGDNYTAPVYLVEEWIEP